ncbi:hypothetical protein ACFQVD_43015 [Streptosporangium amethystogenes subsp. fukuiense]|uniref:Uncharacterized protein n=1 Tax=Streptosporangium amethystogenes subsp. fukuiense TaxID=698418 RepID=A0ABW2TEP8_9ACTN
MAATASIVAGQGRRVPRSIHCSICVRSGPAVNPSVLASTALLCVEQVGLIHTQPLVDTVLGELGTTTAPHATISMLYCPASGMGGDAVVTRAGDQDLVETGIALTLFCVRLIDSSGTVQL